MSITYTTAIEMKRGKEVIDVNYTVLHNPSETALNRYAKDGWRIISCVPDIHTRYQGCVETTIVVILEREVAQ